MSRCERCDGAYCDECGVDSCICSRVRNYQADINKAIQDERKRCAEIAKSVLDHYRTGQQLIGDYRDGARAAASNIYSRILSSDTKS